MANLGNMYPNLPGMLVEFKDGGSALRFNQVQASTDSLLLLGTAIDGPIMEPVAVDVDSVEILFGSDLKSNGAPNGSTLVHAFKQAYDAGCQDIRVMRISGQQATAEIGASDVVVTSNKRKDEDLTVVQGNDLTVLTLTGTGINPGTVKVFARGIELNSGFSFNGATNQVTINANTCDAGASILIKYEYTENVAAPTETLTVNSSNQVILATIPVAGTLVVTDELGTTIPEAGYSVIGNAVTFIDSVLPGDVVKFDYQHAQIGTGTENGSGVVPFTAATSEQVIGLSGTPIDGSTVLYVDDARVLDTAAFTVDIVANTIRVKKEFFKMGQVLSTSYYVTANETVRRKISLKSNFGGDIYNTGLVEVQNITDSLGTVIGKSVKITKPESKRTTGEQPQVYTSFNYPTFGDLIDAINANNGVYIAETDTPGELISELLNTNSYFAGGDNGINLSKDQLFEALSGRRNLSGYIEKQGAYQLLENYMVDWIVPCGVYADDELADRHQDFAYELALFCAVLSYRNKTTIGSISVKPLKNTSLAGVQAHAKYLANLNNLYFMRDASGSIIRDSAGEPIDLGKFINVVVGPTPTVNHRAAALREGNPAVLYAANNTVLQPQSAATNKKLRGCTGIKYSFSNAQLNEIVANRLVVIGTKYSRSGAVLDGAYVIDAPTSARPGSEYTRLTSLKVMRSVADNMREVADPYIGEPNTIEQRNALSAAISKRLDILVERGVIVDYSFNLVATALDQVLGQAKLELGIYAPQELRKLTTVMGLKR